MAKRPKKTQYRIGKKQLADRVFAIETVLGPEAAKKIGISKSSLQRYKAGTQTPKQKNYEKVNRAYNKYKGMVRPEKVIERKTIYKKRQQISKAKLIKEIHIPIYPDYMQMVLESLGAENVDRLIKLHEKGYIFAYYGTGKEDTAQFGQFILHGTPIKENTEGRLHIIVTVSYNRSPRTKRNKHRVGRSRDINRDVRDFAIPPIIEKYSGFKRDATQEEQFEMIFKFCEQSLNQSIDNRVNFMDVLGFYYEEV